MRYGNNRALLTILVALLWQSEAHAIAYRHDRDWQDYSAFARETQFQAAGSIVWGDGQPHTYGVCGAVLISPTMALSAGHCLSGKMDRIDDLQFVTVQTSSSTFTRGADGKIPAYPGNIESVSLHPVIAGGGFGNGIDLAILHLSEPVTGVEPIPLIDFADVRGERGVWVGGGGFVDGFGNPGPRVLDSDTFDEFQAGENRIDVYWASGLGTDFDNPDSDEHDGWNLGYPEPYNLEGDTRSGDSGSPFFVQLHGKWYLTGIVSGGGDYGEPGIPYGDGSVMATWVSPHDPSTLSGNVIQTHINTRNWMLSQGVTMASVPALAGDLDFDGDLDGADLSAFFSNFTGPNNGPPADTNADLDGDGDVDGVDISGAFSAFTGPLSPNNVPEPVTVAFLGIGGILIARRR